MWFLSSLLGLPSSVKLVPSLLCECHVLQLRLLQSCIGLCYLYIVAYVCKSQWKIEAQIAAPYSVRTLMFHYDFVFLDYINNVLLQGLIKSISFHRQVNNEVIDTYSQKKTHDLPRSICCKIVYW